MAATLLPLSFAFAAGIAVASAAAPSLRGPGLSGAAPTNASSEEHNATHLTSSSQGVEEPPLEAGSPDHCLARVDDGSCMVQVAPLQHLQGVKEFWEFLWRAAWRQCGGECRLSGRRVEEKLYIRYWHQVINSTVRTALASALCRKAGWQPVAGKAVWGRLFDTKPNLLGNASRDPSDLEAMLGFTTCPGGSKVMVLIGHGGKLEDVLSSGPTNASTEESTATHAPTSDPIQEPPFGEGGQCRVGVDRDGVLPWVPVADLQPASAKLWDFPWYLAWAQCGPYNCVLKTQHSRTQDALRIRYSTDMRENRMLSEVWEPRFCWMGSKSMFSITSCSRGKAGLFDSMPGVSSVVAAAYADAGESVPNSIEIKVFMLRCPDGDRPPALVAPKVVVLACNKEENFVER